MKTKFKLNLLSFLTLILGIFKAKEPEINKKRRKKHHRKHRSK